MDFCLEQPEFKLVLKLLGATKLVNLQLPDIYSAMVIELLTEFKHRNLQFLDYDAVLLAVHAKAVNDFETGLIFKQL